ncbi:MULTISPECIES: hypothetical protein [unclassified Streptomyces]|uniref:hypothetical protein n=1 Tax=unclassified Streptomyces TaxID=2593676 RepID=UPI00278C7095|nr:MULTISPECIES: hypothetical protein [unclassified Streptomyces]
MGVEIGELVQQAGPYVATAATAYGTAFLTRVEGIAVDATANATAGLGRRVLQRIWHRRDAEGRAALEAAVRDVAEGDGDEDALAALRQQLKRALREDADLAREVAAMLSAAPVAVTASGPRSIAAQSIGTAVTGDGNTVEGQAG